MQGLVRSLAIKDSWIAALTATVLAVGVNIAASVMSWDGVESLIGWSTWLFLGGSLLLWVLPTRLHPALCFLSLGGWPIVFRFTGDMGQSHFSGGFLGFSLFVFTISLGLRSLTSRA